MRSLPGDSAEHGQGGASPVDCGTAQEALSARLDGEREPVPATRVDSHVAACAACADWWQRAMAQAAELRLESVRVAPMFHVELPEAGRSLSSRLSRWLRAERARGRDDIEIRAPEGARFGRKTGHLRVADEAEG